MSFYENMSTARKRIVLSASKESLESEMLQIIIRLGLNPETFDENSYTVPEDGLSPALVPDSVRLADICTTYKSTMQRLEELES